MNCKNNKHTLHLRNDSFSIYNNSFLRNDILLMLDDCLSIAKDIFLQDHNFLAVVPKHVLLRKLPQAKIPSMQIIFIARLKVERAKIPSTLKIFSDFRDKRANLSVQPIFNIPSERICRQIMLLSFQIYLFLRNSLNWIIYRALNTIVNHSYPSTCICIKKTEFSLCIRKRRFFRAKQNCPSVFYEAFIMQ